MGIMSTGYKGKIVVDAAGMPTGVSEVVPASFVEGALGGLTGILSDTTFFTGAAKTASELAKIATAVVVTSKITSGSFVPRKLG